MEAVGFYSTSQSIDLVGVQELNALSRRQKARQSWQSVAAAIGVPGLVREWGFVWSFSYQG